jgi:DNA-binding NtrC family response regulator
VRELRNAIERAMVIEESSRIELDSLPPDIGHFHQPPACSGSPEEDLSLAGSERRLLIRALEKSCGNQTRAAVMLGVTRDTLRYRIKKHGL